MPSLITEAADVAVRLLDLVELGPHDRAQILGQVPAQRLAIGLDGSILAALGLLEDLVVAMPGERALDVHPLAVEFAGCSGGMLYP